MNRILFRRLERLEQASRVSLPWGQPLREWTDEQLDELDGLNRQGLRLAEAHALILDDIANDPPPERVDVGKKDPADFASRRLISYAPACGAED